MDKLKIDLKDALGKKGKAAIDLMETAKKSVVKLADQNDDGELNLKDAVIVGDTLGSVAKNTANAIKDGIEGKSRKKEQKLLKPIFSEDLDSAEFYMSKLIHITDIDKKRAESEVCKGAIGFMSMQKELKIVNLFQNKIDDFGLTFYPDQDSEVYYVDPSNRNSYIALDDYFNYLKVARINELQRIAQTLGARHFKVTYKEQKISFSNRVIRGKANVKLGKDTLSAEAERDLSSTGVSKVEIAAEMECPGHLPVEPQLQYLQKDPSIQTLISLRMNQNAPLTHQKVTLKFSNSSGIKEKDAVKIDAALRSMKVSGNTTVTNEVKNEERRFFEYEIDF